MDIPPYIQSALRIGTPATPADLKTVFDQSGPQSIFGLSSDDFETAAIEIDDSVDSIEMSKLSRAPADWKYLEVWNDGTRECFGVGTPSENAGLPPTAAGQALVKAWFVDSSTIDGSGISEGNLIKGLLTVGTVKDFASRLLDTWGEACVTLDGSRVTPSWITNTQILIQRDSKLVAPSLPGLKYESLFIEALSEVKVKWRYFSLYRILEHGYLSEIFNQLKNEFFFSPKETLQKALTSVESELKQFVSLAAAGGLEAEFEVFYDEFQKVKGALNRFANAIDRSIQVSGQHKLVEGKWQCGVLVCYKIRCAIVHSGLSSPIFEAYVDGPACLEVLLPRLESISLKFLGVVMA